MQNTKVLSVRFCIFLSIGLFPIFGGLSPTLKESNSFTLEKHFMIVNNYINSKLYIEIFF